MNCQYGERDGFEVDARRASRECLDRKIVVMIVLDLSRGFYLHHAPRNAPTILLWKHDVGKSQHALRRESRLENGTR